MGRPPDTRNRSLDFRTVAETETETETETVTVTDLSWTQSCDLGERSEPLECGSHATALIPRGEGVRHRRRRHG